MRGTAEIIAGRGGGEANEPPHHRLVVSVFGLYGRKGRTALPVSAVLELLGTLGAEPASVRSSISRLKKRGVLVSADAGGQRGYALAPDLEQHFAAGDRRIFGEAPNAAHEEWLLVAFSVPETHRSQRHLIRSGLERMGFGTVGPGLWIAPLHARDPVERYLREYDLEQFVELFVSSHLGPGSVAAKVQRWWDLDAIADGYGGFIHRFVPVLTTWESEAARAPIGDRRRAFADYVRAVTQWRGLPFLDPGLPRSVLPSPWAGARALFLRLHEVIGGAAAAHVDDVLRG